eukprot:jgi/Chlat1/3546/Chrsp231S03548
MMKVKKVSRSRVSDQQAEQAPGWAAAAARRAARVTHGGAARCSGRHVGVVCVLTVGGGVAVQAGLRFGTAWQLSSMADSISILGAVLGALGFALSLVTLWFGRRDRKLELMWQLNTQYTKEMMQALSTITCYKGSHCDYYEKFRDGRAQSQEAKDEIQQVEDARRLLAGFWDWVTDVHDSGSFPVGFLSSRSSTWLQRGNNYRVAVEPFDVANWYRHFFPTENKHYLRDNPADSCTRPRRYYLLQELYSQVYNRKGETVKSSLDEAWTELRTTYVPPAAAQGDAPDGPTAVQQAGAHSALVVEPVDPTAHLANAHSLSSHNRQPMRLRLLDYFNQVKIAVRQLVGSL